MDINVEDLDTIAQAVHLIQETSTAANRDAFVTLDDGRRFLYSDADKKYDEIDRFVKLEGAVSTIESLADLVVTYSKRLNRVNGGNQTVTFTSDGAKYSPDDEDRRHVFTYKRVLSQQWQTLVSLLNKPMSHKELIRALQSLSPSIENYALVMAAFRRLVVSKDVKLASEPVLNESGDSGNSYSVQLSIRGGTTETTLPSVIDLKLQYARASEAIYDVAVDVDLSDRDGVPVITLFAPTLPAIADKAVIDEMKYFDDTMKANSLSETLIVVNF